MKKRDGSSSDRWAPNQVRQSLKFKATLSQALVTDVELIEIFDYNEMRN